MQLRQKIASGTQARLRAFRHIINKLQVRFLRLSKPLQLVAFAVIFAALGGTYLFIVNFASDTYGNIHTKADEVVIAYQLPEDGYTLVENDIPEGENLSGMLLYGNGLMLCGAENVQSAAGSDAIYSRNLSRSEIREMFAYVRSNGFDDLYKNPDPKSMEQPVEAATSIILNTSKGSRRVVEPISSPSEQFNAIRQYLKDECAKATTVYDTSDVIVETITLDTDGRNLPELPADLIDYDKTVHTKKGTVEVGEKGKKIKEKIPYGLHQFKTEDNKTLKVRTSQQIPSYQPFISVKWRGNEDSSGKVSAQSGRSVRFLYVVAADQATPGDAQAYINDVAATLPGYYQGQVGRTFVTSGTAVVRGSMTAGQYQTCPAGENCSGHPSLASYYNLRNEFRLDGVNTIIFYSWNVGQCIGWGGPIANTDSAAFSHGLTASPAANCNWEAARRSQAAHEGGHGFGLVHTCDATMMRDSDPARNCPPKAAGYGAPLNQAQINFLRDHSPYFAATTAPPPPTSTNSCQASNAVGTASKRDLTGYWFVDGAGVVYNCGTAGHFGDMRGRALAKPVVGMAATPSGNGYWLVASDGGIFNFGDAAFHGSMGGTALNSPIVGIASHPSNGGYWMVSSDGGIFAFGATFYGSMGGQPLNKPIVGMASSATGNGYWLYAADGGLFAFGDATFHGSTGNLTLAQPIVAMAPNPQGGGYWLVARDGGVFAFGNSIFHGSAANEPNKTAIVGILIMPDGKGYSVMTASGQSFQYGSAVGGGVSGPDPTPPPLPDFKTSMSWNNAWPYTQSPTNISAAWNSAWPQKRNPTGVQMTFYTAWDGGPLPGYCAQIHESSAPWEYTWMDNQLCSNLDLGLSYTSAWPAGQPIPGNCVKIQEPSEPAQYTWDDNVLCTNKVDIGMRWSYNGSLADDNTDCVLMNESSDPYTWWDNYLCWNKYWPGTENEPGPAGCISLNETADPNTWYDNVLCMSPDLGLSWNTAHPDPTNLPPYCVRLYEPSDPHSWHDNVLCSSNTNVRLEWSWQGNLLEDADTGCVQIYDNSEAAYWFDNYLCWNRYYAPVPDPLPAGCIYINEPAAPWEYTWDDNVLCASPDVGLSYTSAFPAGSAVPNNCVRIFEPGAPAQYTWDDNVLCTSTYIALRWSYGGSLDDETTDCVSMNEPSDPYYWHDNYLCWYVPQATSPPPPPSAGQPDLVVTGLTWNPSLPQVGNQVAFTATIKNQGNAPTPNGVHVGVSFWVDGTAIGWNIRGALAAGQSSNVTGIYDGPNGNGTWTATANSHTAEAFVDDANLITNEIDENNNKFSKTLTVGSTSSSTSAPANLRGSVISSSAVALAWDASTGGPGVTSYTIYRNNIAVGVAGANQLTFNDSGLTPSTTYTYEVAATDSSGATSPRSNVVTLTTLASTNNAPSAPLNLRVTGVSSGTVSLAWDASTDDKGVHDYYIYRDGAIVAIQPHESGTSITDFNRLTASTTYTYQVSAVDFDGAESAKSNSVSATTQGASDTTPPTAPTGFTATVVSSTQVNLSWTSSTDTGGSGLAGYNIFRNGTKIGTSATTTYGDATAAPNIEYTYHVTAYDAANNVSGSSNTATVKTPGNAIPEDINEDGSVNALDFLILRSKYGQTGTDLGRADINGDGAVNALDFLRFRAAYGS